MLGPYGFFALAGLSLLMFSIDSTIVAVALPTMMADLGTSLPWIGWTLTAYTLVQTVVMPLAGKLSENFGRLRVFLACVTLFTVGSLLCGLAPNVYWLILFRAMQALGGGGFMPSAVGIVAEQFPKSRDRMVGLFASIFPIGGIIGPNLGGILVEHASWRWVFLVNVPIGLLVLAALLLRRNPADDAAIAERRIDAAGAVLLAGMIAALLTAMTLLGEDPAFGTSPLFWGLLLASVGLLIGFAWQEVHTPEPVIDLSLVGRNPFLAVNIYNFLFGATVFGFSAFMPYFAQVQYGLSPALSGAVLAPRSVVMVGVSAAASIFLIRWGYRLPMVAGLAFWAATLLLLSQGWGGVSVGSLRVEPFWLLAFEIGLSGVGSGLAAPSSNNAALDLLPGRAAVVTGIRGMFRSTGGVLGAAVIVLALQFSPDKAGGLRSVFLAMAILMLATIPLTFIIPDAARSRRMQRQEARTTPAPRGVGAD
ncbi:MAG TPA: MFS transporter [Chloroflexota bacterium]|nr:MFS transporter [Chloroflexota bacterium]